MKRLSVRMKRLSVRVLGIWAIPTACFALGTLLACSEENGVANPASNEEVIDRSGDPSSATPIQVPQPVPRVDLIVTSYTTTVVPTTTSCGALLPNVSCVNGQRSFMSTATIQNLGPGTLPAGNISVGWTDLTTGSYQVQTVPHPSISPGATFPVTRPYWMGPCDCVPPPSFFLHGFNAKVDPNNVIPETNENNNVSTTYTACDGC